ncbi:cysteine desulfurase family protein [Pedobacter metabolipauper]|uniref:cysteine desulfurase n=1 Tax=Pedobacter metabolipauper TaxID=425513 RepID=A0A4R6T047_9SPHI|nr:cysteine desulfurase family protein [Pedobacter metabolipauper]TDQ10928.1 cysteine desulfurase [Pedobacter metabolipauper]
MRIYLDNAATTPLSREVFLAMEPFLFENFGNPSSSHFYGRKAKAAVELSRNTIAELLNTDPNHIVFTSGGTEADNIAILSAIHTNGIKVAITSHFEHHAVLNTLKSLQQKGIIQLIYLNHDDHGNLSVTHLEQLLSTHGHAFVSVMHGNNEIGNLNDIELIAEICCRYGAIFHSDTVQTMGHYQYDTKNLKVDFLVGSAHKFHGPKGVGFLYNRASSAVQPLIHGGAQEKGQRSGTENVTGIVGLAKALELTQMNPVFYQNQISSLKERMITKLLDRIPGIKFNGNSSNKELSVSKVLSVSFPDNGLGQTVLDYLDLNQICASGGSACSSRSASGSHVLRALGNEHGTTIRFSFSRYNTAEEIDYVVEKLVKFNEDAVEQVICFAAN